MDITPAEHTKNVLAGAVFKTEELKKTLCQMERSVEQIENVKRLLATIPEGEEELFHPELLTAYERVDKALSIIRTGLFSSYWALTEPDPESKIGPNEGTLSLNFNPVFDVKAAVLGDELCVKLPLLWSRYQHHGGGAKWQLNKDYLSWFQRELSSELESIYPKIPSYQQRHFSYLHVVSGLKHQTPDNDNFDTKSITDLVTSYMGGTDGPLTTSFSSVSILDDELPAGSYLVVSPCFWDPPKMDHLLQTLKTAFTTSFL